MSTQTSHAEAAAAGEVRHPLFARFFDRLSKVMEKEIGAHRDELLSGLCGQVVEIGPGNGMNFSRYPTTVSEVLAFEPEPYLRAKAQAAAVTAPVPVTVRSGVAAALDLPDASVDAAVACLVLCTVPDQPTALAELRRVLKPAGQLRFLEHVRAPQPGKARFQLNLDRSGIWPRLAGGCHCSRDTVAAIEAAGFHLEDSRPLSFGPSWMCTNPHMIGRAVAR